MSCASINKCTENDGTRGVWSGRFGEWGDGFYADEEGGEVLCLHAVFGGFDVAEEFEGANVGGDGGEEGWEFP